MSRSASRSRAGYVCSECGWQSAKWVGYQDIPSLQHYVLVAQESRRAELFTRADDGWHLRIIRAPRSKGELSAISVELTLDEIYEDNGV